MNRPESIQLFETFVKNIPEVFKHLVVSPQVKNVFNDNLRKAKRVFITGTGTSLPTAQYLEFLLRQKLEKPVYFLSTGEMMRQATSLEPDDLVVLISHGMNRADSLIIYNACLERSVVTVITGNHSLASTEKAQIIKIPPQQEKIFCRPVSPLTTIATIEYLVNDTKPRLPKLLRSYENIAKWCDPGKQLIITYTADVTYAAQLWGIILREGAGLNVLIKEIENYAHGFYGVDTAHLEDRQYLLLTSNSRDDQRDLQRALPLYELQGLDKQVLTADGSGFDANIQLFYEGTWLILSIIQITNHDMNHPKGMEENRKYHEYDHHSNYI